MESSILFYLIGILYIAVDLTFLLYFFSILNTKVNVKKLSSYARISQKVTLGSACFDLYLARFLLLEVGKTPKIETDIVFKFSL